MSVLLYHAGFMTFSPSTAHFLHNNVDSLHGDRMVRYIYIGTLLIHAYPVVSSHHLEGRLLSRFLSICHIHLYSVAVFLYLHVRSPVTKRDEHTAYLNPNSIPSERLKV